MRPPMQLLAAREAAVAPTIALSLFGLIAAGGVAFDYARLATMDSELQAGADQAALAAATQLDGKTGACSRAATAANTLVVGQTLFANDSNSDKTAVTVPLETDCDATGNVRFYQDKAKTTAATSASSAHFVEVTVNAREAHYALTPIVAALRSGTIAATAFAGMGSAICKVPPVMMCNPAEPLSNTNESLAFDASSYVGKGMRLVTGNADTPGNFGFLETDFGNGAQNLAKALGYNTPPGNCTPIDGISTKTGMNASVMDALNTRFDLDANGSTTCPSGGTCSPSANVRKDLVRKSGCGIAGGSGWQESDKPYRPAAGAAPSHTTVTASTVDVMGHPRDICHAVSQNGDCTGGRIGDGVWDRDAYFKVNYGYANQAAWMAATGLSANATRYQVYQWELANPGVGAATMSGGTGGKTAYRFPVCRGTGITPGGSNVDRRRISAAVVNCHATNLHGHSTGVPVATWVDLFLVEPSVTRKKITSPNANNTMTQATDVYVEIIGQTNSGAAGSTAGQVVRRDVPYLIE